MELKFRVTRTRLVLLVVAAAVVTMGGIGYAAIPDGNGVFTACRLNGVGTIRLIDPTATPASSLLNHCTGLETKISWNQGGPSGSQGPTGDKGATGDKGPAGDQGPVGDKGPTGDQGPVGDKGPDGDKGPTGDTGAKGPAGDKGLVGDKGPTGDAGSAADWAVVASGGFIVRQSGGITVTRLRTGAYNVDFGHNVSQCAVMGSGEDPGARNASLDPPAEGIISFTESGNNGGPLPNIVLVGVHNGAGTLIDGNFSIHVDC